MSHESYANSPKKQAGEGFQGHTTAAHSQEVYKAFSGMNPNPSPAPLRKVPPGAQQPPKRVRPQRLYVTIPEVRATAIQMFGVMVSEGASAGRVDLPPTEYEWDEPRGVWKYRLQGTDGHPHAGGQWYDEKELTRQWRRVATVKYV